MAAGLGFKDFVTGEVLTAADVDGYLMQGIWVFASAAARDAAVTSPQEGNACYLKDTNQVLTYSGSAWVAVGGGSPLTTKGDVYGFSTVDARIPIGANNTVLTADSTQSLGLKWAAVSSGALTYVGGASFSASSAVNVNDVFSATYANYIITSNFTASAGGSARFRLRVSGSDDTNATYAGQYLFLYGSTVDCSRAATGTYFDLGGVTGSDTNTFTMQIARPFDSVKTQAIYDHAFGTGVNIQRAAHGFNFNATTSFTGFTIFPNTGNITGDVRVYGLANS